MEMAKSPAMLDFIRRGDRQAWIRTLVGLVAAALLCRVAVVAHDVRGDFAGISDDQVELRWVDDDDDEAAVPGARWIEVNDEVDEARYILSEEEIERIYGADNNFNGDMFGVDEDDEEEDDDDDEEEEYYDDLWLFQHDPVEVGHIQNVEVEEGRLLQMKTLAINPPVFEIENFLSDAECDYIIQLAADKGLQSSQTVPDDLELSPDDQQATRDFFSELDTSRDGLLDAPELREALQEFPLAKDVNLTLGQVEALIAQKLDRNADGLLDIDEFLLSDTPAMEEEIDTWIAEVGELGESAIVKLQARVSDQTWLDQWSTTDSVLLRLQGRVIDLTMLPSAIVQTSEHLQVVRYHPGGHYHAHYDSNELDDSLECAHTYGIEDEDDERKIRDREDFSVKRLCRLATVLYYLNDVEEGGETAFPVADNETFTEESLRNVSYDIYDLSNNCYKSNLVVPPRKGKAILWYNHYLDEELGWLGTSRNHSLHGGCDVRSGTKWIANNWITVDDDVERQIMLHHRHFSGLDQAEFMAREYPEDDSDDDEESDALVEDARMSAEGTESSAERVVRITADRNDLKADDVTMDEGYHSDSEHESEQVRSTLDTRHTPEDSFHKKPKENKKEPLAGSGNQGTENENAADDLSQRKKRNELNDSNKKSTFMSGIKRSGADVHSNDEL